MAGVIRRDVPTAARPLSLRDVRARADAILQAARAEAAELIARAQQEAELLRQRAEREGFAQGRDDGLTDGRRAGREELDGAVRAAALQQIEQRVRALADALTAALDAFDQAKRGLLASAESGLVTLACEIARRVCTTFPRTHPDVVRATVQRVIEMARHENDLRLRVNPDEFDVIERFLPDLLARLGKAGHVSLAPDSAVAPGGCIIDGRNGTIDADIHTQLQRLAEQLVSGAQAPAPAPSAATAPAPDVQTGAAAGRFQPESVQ